MEKFNMQSDREIIFSLKHICKIYQFATVPFYALKDINFDIFSGEFLAILGPSGSGKSTLMNIIGGTDRPSAGQIKYFDQDLTEASDRELTLYRRNQVGFIFQFYNLLPTLTALENIEVITAIARNPLNPSTALDLVGIEHLANKFPAQMSGGEQQRVAIARALAGNARLLLCDEPTGALDSVNSNKVMDLLVDLCRRLQKNIIFLTHNRDLTIDADRIIELKDGQIEKIEIMRTKDE